MKILVVDDDPDALLLARFALEDLGGHGVITAQEGTGLVSRVLEERPDAILLDYRLPGIRGDQLARQLADHPATAQIPVFFVTAEDDPDAEQRLLATGARGIFPKPLDLTELAGRLESAMGSRDDRA